MYTLNRLFITDLTTEHLINPVGIDCASPRFCWKLKSGGFNVEQTAWQMILFEKDRQIFDTGRIQSSQSTETVLPGFEAQPVTRYDMQVTVWDNKGRSASAFGFFETGRMGMPFKSSWVEPVQEPTPSSMDSERDGDTMAENAIPRDADGNRTYEEFRLAQYIRIPFNIRKSVRGMRIYTTAHGLYRLEINGTCPRQRLLAPENTAYHRLLLYQTYDVTEFLRPGENVIGAVLADG